MTKNNNFKNNSQISSRVDKRVFNKAFNVLTKDKWDPVFDYDTNLGYTVVAGRSEPEFGYVTRCIKLFALDSLTDFDRALRVQLKVKLHLVQVCPFKKFLGNKIYLHNLDKPFKWLSEADRQLCTKFFKSKKDMVNY